MRVNTRDGEGQEHDQGQGSAIQHLIVEGANVELGDQVSPGSFAELANLQLAKLVTKGLRRPRDVTVGFGLDGRLVHGSRLAEKLHNLIACPTFGVDSCVHNQPHGPEEFGGKSAVVRNGILVKAHLFAELLRIEGPAFRGGVETQSVEPKLRQAGELLLHRKLHVVARNAFMVSNRFVVDQRALGKLRGSYDNTTRTLAVGSARDIVRRGRRLERRNGLDGYGRFGQQSEEIR